MRASAGVDQRKSSIGIHDEIAPGLVDIGPGTGHGLSLPPEPDIPPQARQGEGAPPRQTAEPIRAVDAPRLVDQAGPVAELEATAVAPQPAGRLEADHEYRGVARFKLRPVIAQLREVLFSKESTQVAQEYQDGPAPAEVRQGDSRAISGSKHEVRGRCAGHEASYSGPRLARQQALPDGP
jgi:hypothetical protein